MPPRTARAAKPRSPASAGKLAPARIIALLEGEYGTVPWRPAGDPIAELVLTLLSQATSDTNSGRAFIRLLNDFPDWGSLLDADVKAIERAIEPGGLAPTKAPRLQALLREVWSRRGSFDLTFLRDMPLDEARAWLRSLPGVGPKTAACVLLFSLGVPALPVDTHVHRVAKRLGLVPEKTSAEKAHDLLEAMLTPGQVYPFHIQLIKHGRRTCSAQRPKCPECPLRNGCPAVGLFHPELIGRARG
ncbi:MAG: endonuclease III [Dehalococcoidia bacterium]